MIDLHVSYKERSYSESELKHINNMLDYIETQLNHIEEVHGVTVIGFEHKEEKK